ncbi:hypothetical protein HZB02_04215 [Candidatus Woesearchaeota archaeon]|nr:hypothetical protein [Candidatus Woesearchaeota archaeon]
MKNSWIWMGVACVVPLLLLWMLPSFGFSNDVIPLIFIMMMLLAHVMMMTHDENSHHNGRSHTAVMKKSDAPAPQENLKATLPPPQDIMQQGEIAETGITHEEKKGA